MNILKFHSMLAVPLISLSSKRSLSVPNLKPIGFFLQTWASYAQLCSQLHQYMLGVTPLSSKELLCSQQCNLRLKFSHQNSIETGRKVGGISLSCVNWCQRKYASKTVLIPDAIRTSSLLSSKPVLSWSQIFQLAHVLVKICCSEINFLWGMFPRILQSIKIMLIYTPQG